MIRTLVKQNRKKDASFKECERQFPDCPLEKSKETCKGCPFWK